MFFYYTCIEFGKIACFDNGIRKKIVYIKNSQMSICRVVYFSNTRRFHVRKMKKQSHFLSVQMFFYESINFIQTEWDFFLKKNIFKLHNI